MDSAARAKQAIGLLDLTDLTDACTDEAIVELCQKAKTPHGSVAAICIWPQFVPQARELLAGSAIKIATVTNFPAGDPDVAKAVSETADAIAKGADEVDVVMPYQRFLQGDEQTAHTLISECRAEIPMGKILKVILETGLYRDADAMDRASRLAIEAGAHFIKTSTGKAAVAATEEAATVMLKAIAETDKNVGFKAAGGIRTTEDASRYLAITENILGADWITPETFRFGASGLLSALLATVDGDGSAEPAEGY